jgi:glycosyltransferase involved in cell wall biosynthesis
MTEIDKSPKVSIGLAVYNGEKYLQEAIDSILAQTFTDFELIISDNASSDRTEEICREYATCDSRIRYYRNATNIGGIKNENLTFALSRGQYFRLAAHDDVLAPELLEKCVEVLDRNPSVILSYTTTIKIDRQSNYLGTIDRDMANSNDPCKRLRDLTRHHDCELAYGLIKADILHKTELQPDYPESDFGFLCELSLYGQFYRVCDPLFYRRYHLERSALTYSDIFQKIAWLKPEVKDPNYNNIYWLDLITGFLNYQFIQFLHFWRAIERAPLNAKQRFNCYLYVIIWLVIKLHKPMLGKTWKLRQKLFLTRESIFPSK